MNLVSLEDVSKQYSERQLLDGVNLLVNEGDRIGRIGLNGSGRRKPHWAWCQHTQEATETGNGHAVTV